jgi:hypothetical protein
VLLVAGRTRYQFDLIDQRFLAQFAWILWGVTLSSVAFLFPSRPITNVIAIGLAACVLPRLKYVATTEVEPSVSVSSDVRLLEDLRRWASEGGVILSGDGPLLSLLADVNVRRIYPTPSSSGVESYEQALSTLVGDAGLAGVELHAVMLTTRPCFDLGQCRLEVRGWDLERMTPSYVVLVSRPATSAGREAPAQ